MNRGARGKSTAQDIAGGADPVVRTRQLGRRDVLKMSLAAGGAALLAACTTEGVKPSPTPGISGDASVTPAPAGSPGATGAGSFAKLEGPTIVTDPSKFPTTLKEAPELA